MASKYPFFLQHDSSDCGAACLRMILMNYGIDIPQAELTKKTGVNRNGTSISALSRCSKEYGLNAITVKIPFELLVKEVKVPCILSWKENHYVVLFEASENNLVVGDPSFGILNYTKVEFLKNWGNKIDEGVALLFEKNSPTVDKSTAQYRKGLGWLFIFNYLQKIKGSIILILLLLFIGSIFSLLLPVLTQKLVDSGIKSNDIGYVYLVLAGQLMIYVGRTITEVIRSRILLNVSTRVSIDLVSDFLKKLMKLPIHFFEGRGVGDILQRIYDHERIRNFLTSTSLQTLFSISMLVVFSVLLFTYSHTIGFIFLFSTALYWMWVLLFLRKRRLLDFKRFTQFSSNREMEVQIVQGITDIKLASAQDRMKTKWEDNQTEIHALRKMSLNLEQIQGIGGTFIDEMKNIVILFWAAQEVISQSMTLGMMMASTQILGQMKMPVGQFILFLQQAQDSKLSFDRMRDLYELESEDEGGGTFTELNSGKDIVFEAVDYSYVNDESARALKHISLTIPSGKKTAIVGVSGSGKTTLTKLLLKLSSPTNGSIIYDGNDFKDIHIESWRKKCGAVIQGGFIFNESVAANIAFGNAIDLPKVERVAEIARCGEFINSLPNQFDTRLGTNGLILSKGQEQRILIARALYRDPEILVFDEATSALDTENEHSIIQNIEKYLNGKTIVVVAHRLSTVINSDQIVVLDAGEIIERGTHSELLRLKGKYHSLVKDQLNLDV